MKHIYLNLKRFDVPVELGGVNRLAPVEHWAQTVVHGIQEGLKRYHPAQTEFAVFFPEGRCAVSAAESSSSPCWMQ